MFSLWCWWIHISCKKVEKKYQSIKFGLCACGCFKLGLNLSIHIQKGSQSLNVFDSMFSKIVGFRFLKRGAYFFCAIKQSFNLWRYDKKDQKKLVIGPWKGENKPEFRWQEAALFFEHLGKKKLLSFFFFLQNASFDRNGRNEKQKERNLGSNEPNLQERERSSHISEHKRKNLAERTELATLYKKKEMFVCFVISFVYW